MLRFSRVAMPLRYHLAPSAVTIDDLVTEFTYNEVGSKLTQKDPNGNVTEFGKRGSGNKS
jgi:hypothetical protein